MLHLLQKNLARLITSVSILLVFSGFAVAQSFGVGNLTVLRIGDGSAALSSAATPIAIVEFTPAGTATTMTVSLPSTGTTKITNSGTASSEGFMSLSAEHDQLVVAGYDDASGTAGVSGSASASVNRELFTVTSGGTYTKVASTSTAYSGNNIRSGTASGTNYFGSGATNGIELMNSSTQLTASTTKGRVIEIINGQTYFSSNDNPTYDGLNQLGTGIPTTGGQTTTRISPASTSPFGFAISPDGNTMYMADDGTGITKYTWSGSAYVMAYLVNSTPARGLAVDFSSTNPVLYATTTAASANTIIKMTDAGGAASATTIATAPANTVYQGITFAPSCFASITTLTTTMCSGGSTKVVIKGNPTATVSYKINGGSTLITTIGNNGYDTLSTGTLTTNTTYTLVSITTGVCSSVALSGTVTITVNSLPAAITGSSTLCNGATTQLSDISGGGTWASLNTSVATINSSGMVTGAGTGNAGILYTLSTGCSITATITVNAIPSAITGANAVCVGANIPLSDVTTGGVWSSTNSAVATISSSPLVYGSSSGTSVISYTVSGCAATASVVVNAVPSAIAGTTTVCAGDITALTDAPAGGTWSSANTGVATINSSGIVMGVAAGNAGILYTVAGGCSATTTVTVNASPAAITGANAVCVGATIPLSDATAGGVWSNTNTAVATLVTSPVLVHGSSSGSTVISYTLSGCAATLTVTVNAAPSAISGTTTVCAGSMTTLSDTETGGTWSSSNTSVATIGVSGYDVTGVTAGTTTIAYTMPAGCGSTTTTVTVNPLPVAGSILGTPTVMVGGVIYLTDATSGGTWSSANGGVATVNATGTVTGVSGGTTVISYSVSNGCGTAVATTTITSVPEAVNSVTATGAEVNVFPNPNSGVFTVLGTPGITGNDEVQIEVTDMLGHVVYKKNVVAQNGKINEQVQLDHNLVSGVYLLNVRSSGGGKIVRVLVQ